MNFCHRYIIATKFALCWALLLPSCCSPLSSHERPRASVPPPPVGSLRSSSLGQSVKQWAAASLLAASLVLAGNAGPAAAAPVPTETTRIELNVETDYLVRVLGYFDGDMKKALAAIVRSPFSTVKIDPPERARDALLRALYSYSAPEDYVEQASWLTIQPKKSSVDNLLEKKYKVTLPSLLSGDEEDKRPLAFSALELGLAAAVLTYPLTYGVYQYDNYRQEQEAIAKRSAFKAKKAAAEKIKRAAAKKSVKGETSKAATKRQGGIEEKKAPQEVAQSTLKGPIEDTLEKPKDIEAGDAPKQQSEPQKIERTVNRGVKSDGGMDVYAAQLAALSQGATPAVAPQDETAPPAAEQK